MINDLFVGKPLKVQEGTSRFLPPTRASKELTVPVIKDPLPLFHTRWGERETRTSDCKEPCAIIHLDLLSLAQGAFVFGAPHLRPKEELHACARWRHLGVCGKGDDDVPSPTCNCASVWVATAIYINAKERIVAA